MQVERSEHLAWARAAARGFVLRANQEPAILVFSLSLVAICLDYALAPILYTLTPAIASGLLLLLLFRRVAPRNTPLPPPSRTTLWRVLPFSLLHAAIVSTVWFSHRLPALGALQERIPYFVLAAAKYVVLLPAAILLPWTAWHRFCRTNRAEWVAAVTVLFTLYPYRLIDTAWPWYSQALGRSVYALAHPFVAGLQLNSLPSPVLTGPGLNVVILFWCSGLESIKLFQMVFLFMVVADWRLLNRRRALFGYFGGLAFMLAANVLRITLLVITGNAFPQLTSQNHVTAGWIFFALALAVYIGLTHGWLLAQGKLSTRAASLAQPDPGPAS